MSYYHKESNERKHMRFNIKEDGKRIVMICLASAIMALNIKSFVRTGGLFPGGANGLTLLIQRIFDMNKKSITSICEVAVGFHHRKISKVCISSFHLMCISLCHL